MCLVIYEVLRVAHACLTLNSHVNHVLWSSRASSFANTNTPDNTQTYEKITSAPSCLWSNREDSAKSAADQPRFSILRDPNAGHTLHTTNLLQTTQLMNLRCNPKTQMMSSNESENENRARLKLFLADASARQIDPILTTRDKQHSKSKSALTEHSRRAVRSSVYCRHFNKR